jgi:hypothetical protein
MIKLIKENKKEILIGTITATVSALIVSAISQMLSMGIVLTAMISNGEISALKSPIKVSMSASSNYYMRGFFGDTDYMTYFEVSISNASLKETDDFELYIEAITPSARVIEFKAHESFYPKDRKGNTMTGWSGSIAEGKELAVLMRVPPMGAEYKCIVAVRDEYKYPTVDFLKVGIRYKTGIYELRHQ